MRHLRTAKWDSQMNTSSSPGDKTSRSAVRGSSPFSKTVAVLIMVVGAGLIAITLFYNLFTAGPAFEKLIIDFRPVLTQSSINTSRAEIESLSAVEKEFTNKLNPALTQLLKMTPEDFNAYLTQSFPAVAAGMDALPTDIAALNTLIDTLESERPLFMSAEDFPTENIPATTIAWVVVGAGLSLFLIGLLMLALPRVGAALAVLIGLLLLIAPFALSLPAKGADVDQLKANLAPIYTQKLISDANGAVATIEAMGEEMQSAMLPALATQLTMDSMELQSFIAINFPATAKALQAIPVSMQRFNSTAHIFDTNFANFNTIKPVSFVNLIMALIACGTFVALLGMLVVLKRGRYLD